VIVFYSVWKKRGAEAPRFIIDLLERSLIRSIHRIVSAWDILPERSLPGALNN